MPIKWLNLLERRITLQNKKFIIAGMLSTIFVSTSLLAATNEQNTKISQLTNTNRQKQVNIKSIADPNWWKKPKFSSPRNLKLSKVRSMKKEPVSNFLQLSLASDWHLISENSGIASAKYQLLFEGERYELSVIRMNSSVPLSSVLSIWQDKVGLVPNSSLSTELFSTQRKQQFKLINLKGEQKSILLAVHQSNKYTFFRLLGDNGINEKVAQKFKDFLSTLYIFN